MNVIILQKATWDIDWGARINDSTIWPHAVSARRCCLHLEANIAVCGVWELKVCGDHIWKGTWNDRKKMKWKLFHSVLTVFKGNKKAPGSDKVMMGPNQTVFSDHSNKWNNQQPLEYSSKSEEHKDRTPEHNTRKGWWTLHISWYYIFISAPSNMRIWEYSPKTFNI